MSDEVDRLTKNVKKLQDDLKELKRLHDILDEYATSGFKEAYDQIRVLREGLKVVAASVQQKGTPKKD